MNHREHLDDSLVTQELRDSLAELTMPRQPPLPAITSRGRGRRRRRRAGLAGVGVSGAAACIALVLGLTGVFGIPRAMGSSVFTVTSTTDGTVSLRLGQLSDPAALQRALAQHGVRALVRIGVYCTSSPPVPDSAVSAALPGSAGSPSRNQFHGIYLSWNLPVQPSQLAQSVDPVTAVINPAALRSGTELYVGYFNHGQIVLADLIYTSSHTCVKRHLMPGAPGPLPAG